MRHENAITPGEGEPLDEKERREDSERKEGERVLTSDNAKASRHDDVVTHDIVRDSFCSLREPVEPNNFDIMAALILALQCLGLCWVEVTFHADDNKAFRPTKFWKVLTNAQQTFGEEFRIVGSLCDCVCWLRTDLIRDCDQ